MSDTKPVGQRFSHVYLRKDELLQDGPRARRRISAWLGQCQDAQSKEGADLGSFLLAEMGVDIVYQYGYDWKATFEKFNTVDFLDAVTLTYKYFTKMRSSPLGMRNPNASVEFLAVCRRIFSEESLAYTIDDGGGVHFKVDAEFATNLNATIAAISGPRYGNVRAEFDKGTSALSAATPDGKEGIRGVFGAAESLYRLIFPKAPKLTSADSSKQLQSAVQSIYSSDAVAQRAASKMVNAFADWVDACHNYRHEQGVEEHSQPPLDLAIEMISAGAGFVRWLVRFDKGMGS
ncbi:hypothetical protein BwSF12_43370 [Bradyrhizobium ottawaense]|uniref:hypothetical protein n=1 Tax=Bradyrhizobium ottawaense TaxID=931866 RepID=UPI0027D71DB3|nr:hypothetical protein BwSF12_43370 [Bradyrhizobium ottawaense]GMO85742.1 hypothetical protein BwSF19_44680 [Bradyrhizobium ottawaense]